MTSTSVARAWRTASPLVQLFMRRWAEEASVHQPEQLLDDEKETCEAFLVSSHGKALLRLQNLVRRTPCKEHFTPEQMLARGGYGAVFHAEHRTSGCAYALKRQSLLQLVSKDHKKRAWLEHRILTSLKSRFLLDATFAWVDERETVLATRFMAGGDVSRYLRGRKGLGEAARFYLASVVLGLEALHAAKICYRDLKSKNVLLDAVGQARLADFGLSADVSKAPSSGSSGTRGHLAPEQYTPVGPDGKKLPRPTYYTSPDLWALGVCVHHWTVGRRPFVCGKASSGSDSDEVDVLGVYRAGFDRSLPLFVEQPALLSLVDGLLTLEPHARLGVRGEGLREVMEHAYFEGFDWAALRQGAMAAPFNPSEEGVPARWKRDPPAPHKPAPIAANLMPDAATAAAWAYVDVPLVEAEVAARLRADPGCLETLLGAGAGNGAASRRGANGGSTACCSVL